MHTLAAHIVRHAGRGLLLAAFASLALAACDRDRDAEDPSQMQGQQPIGYDQNGQPIYPAPGQSGYQGQPGYPNQPGYQGQQGYPQGQQGYPNQPGAYPQGGYPPQQPGAAPGYPPQQQPPASQPSPLALPCQSDFTCGTHKCNLQAGRCAFPCANPQTDCAAGMGCANGICVPGS